MSGKDSVIAVIDIGKTNKKVLIFQQNLKLIDSVSKSFPEYIKNKINYEDIENITLWLKESLHSFSKKYNITVLSITTHGATVFCTDDDAKLTVPPVAYTTEQDNNFNDRFFDLYGKRDNLQRETATAEIGSMVNIAKKIFFLKEKYHDEYKKTTRIHFMPQYLGYLFTGNVGAEPTFPGCHSYLLNPKNKTYSFIVDKMELRDKLPKEISNSWDILGKITSKASAETGLSTECIVTMGIHDSNSSLLPFLIKEKNFILNSTGTWCVAMHPTDSLDFSDEEIGKPVFYNMDVSFNPVKTVVFLGGMEFETYTNLFKKNAHMTNFPKWDLSIYKKVISEKKLFILPSVLKGAGIFPQSLSKIIDNENIYPLSDLKNDITPPCFENINEVYAALNISLAIQTMTAFQMSGFDGKGSIFTEGGFRNNKDYNKLLTAFFPEASIYLSDLKEATAFGAAILGKAALENKTPFELADSININLDKIEAVEITGWKEYKNKYISYL